MNDMRPPRLGPDFRSDNVGAVAPEIIAALAAANTDTATGYGNDTWSEAMQRRFAEIFETKVKVYTVATGTAANALALAAMTPSYGAVFCAENAHITTSEVNAVGFLSGGGRLVHVAHRNGKVLPAALTDALDAAGAGLIHKSQPAALNLVQATDLGGVYTADEVRALTSIVKPRGLRVHMDGARFGNALARLGCRPAEITWKAGVDVLSFGMTKNGGLMCDAIVVFDEHAVTGIGYHIRRAGHVWSKGRYAAAQALAYLENDRWLDMAKRSNALAARMASGIGKVQGVKLVAPVEANQVFLEMPGRVMDALERDGIRFHRRSATMARFVCRFDGTEAEVDAMLASLHRHAPNG